MKYRGYINFIACIVGSVLGFSVLFLFCTHRLYEPDDIIRLLEMSVALILGIGLHVLAYANLIWQAKDEGWWK